MSEAKRFDVHLVTDRFLIRTITLADASERWCQWTADPLAAIMLNARRQPLQLQELRDYIARFDQIDRIMVGLFDRHTGQHFGIIVGEFIDDRKRIMPSMLIGEPEYRDVGVMTEIRNSFGDFVFEHLPFDSAVASVLAHNDVIIKILESRGWKFLRRVTGEKRRANGEGFVDLLYYELPRETWYEYRGQSQPG